MLKDKNELPKLLNDVKGNKLEALELLHYHFSDFIKKYAYKYNIDIETLKAEFDFILFCIISKGIQTPESILGYINICFKNFKNFNIDKVFRLNPSLVVSDYEELSNIIPNLISVESVENEVIMKDYSKLIKIIKPDMIEILEEKFIDKLSCKTIGELNNVSKQRISQRILEAKVKLKKLEL